MRKWLWALYGTMQYLLVANLIFIDTISNITIIKKFFVTTVSLLLFLFYQIIPYWKSRMGVRLNALMGGL